MCSDYLVHTNQDEIEKAIGTSIVNKSPKDEWANHVRLTSMAPVLSLAGENIELHENRFPKYPFPNARLSGLKNSHDSAETEPSNAANSPSHVTEIKRIYELPTWLGFKTQRRLAVMTSFTEFAYWGPQKGFSVEFTIPDSPVFFAAAVGLEEKRASGQWNEFAILTHTATPQMLEFHHRLVVLLTKEAAIQYLRGGELRSPEEKFNELVAIRYVGPLIAKPVKPMAPAWKTRINAQLYKLKQEESYVAALKAEGIQG